MTAESTAEATPNRIENPAITLSGSKTIYLIPQTVIDTLKKWLTTPPYAPLPTRDADRHRPARNADRRTHRRADRRGNSGADG